MAAALLALPACQGGAGREPGQGREQAPDARTSRRSDPLIWLQDQKLLAGDAGLEDYFGYSVSISGDMALVGAPYSDGYLGAAYAFNRVNGAWSQEQKLVAQDGASGEAFGIAVSVSGDIALVGAPYADGYVGAAYAFVRSGGGWFQEQRLLAGDGTWGDSFGHSVSIAGDTALVGAPYADGAGWDSGAAYALVRVNGAWSQEQKLVAQDGASGHALGIAVSVAGDIALVGAPYADGYVGAVYAFVRVNGAWSVEQKLLASDGQPSDFFGYSVSLSGDTALVGAPNDDGYVGAAYVFVRKDGVWSEEQKLLASNGTTSDNFGYSVSISGERALVGAYGTNAYQGSAYVFARAEGAWSQEQQLLVGGPAYAMLGYSVCISGDAPLVGAVGENGYQGAAYVFFGQKVDGDPCALDSECLSGRCVDAVCCDSACGESTLDCQACSVAAGARADGVCGPTTGNDCDDGLYCTGADSCVAGECTGHTGDPCSGAGGACTICDETANSCLEDLDGSACADPDPDPCAESGSCLPRAGDEGGCGCHLPGGRGAPAPWSALLAGLGLGWLWRRTNRARCRGTGWLSCPESTRARRRAPVDRRASAARRGTRAPGSSPSPKRDHLRQRLSQVTIAPLLRRAVAPKIAHFVDGPKSAERAGTPNPLGAHS